MAKPSPPSTPPKPLCLKCGFLSSYPQIKREPPDPRLEALLKTNTPPLEAEKATFRKAKEDLPLIVSDLDERIAQTHQLLHALKGERAQAAEDLRHAKIVLHPMRTIPDDILREIFLHNTLTWEDLVDAGRRLAFHDSLDPRCGPWVLTHVCRNWRSVALSMPSLWNCISLDFNVYYRQRDRPACVALQLGLHIQRARRSPLSIRIESMVDIHTHNAFPIILSSMSQWKHLHIRVPPATCHQLAQCKAFLENLEEACIDGGTFPTSSQRESLEMFQMASNLWRLHIGEHADLRSHRLRLAWSQLTYLSIDIYADMNFNLFKELKKLRSLRIVFPSGPRKLNVSQRITLPKVEYLSLKRKGAAHGVNTLAGVFDMLDLPSLDSLAFGANIEPGLKGMLLDLPTSLSYPGRELDNVSLGFPDYDLSIPENNSRILNFLTQASDVVAIGLALKNIGKDVMKKLTADDVNGYNRFPTLRHLDFHNASFTVSQAALLDMIESRWKNGGEDEESFLNLRRIHLPEDFEFDEPGAEERYLVLQEQGLLIYCPVVD
ncbi:uncharacterized protein EV420DRAFT_1133605 [Desarmillaria tabescens]|uniref:F-box domain-containing protein n=1 Tax=Armillaria tabescens TaxID=1929756 RepID=A0AA39MNN8_ARMTA|nr:uncharacterized protein EV420DRAFT_1133605 [Desarmillaria tabescens]KAK0440404.1 hypothetical protein EV420DRAFT_1133605 [Desarmillaria tabescens]